MSNAVAFLLFAVVVSVVGGTVLALRHRRPTSFTTTIDDFSQRMNALAPADRDEAGVEQGGAS